MHLFVPRIALELAPNHRVEREPHMATDIVAAQLMLMADGGEMEPLPQSNLEARTLASRPDWSGLRILFLRPGGFGDLILLTPVLREIKRRWPTCHIAVSTMTHYAVVLEGLPYVDEVLPFPLPMKMANEFDAWVLYENAIEGNPRATEIHMSELFAEIAGVSVADADMRPEYALKASESLWAAAAYPRQPGVRRVAIQVKTSAKCRDYAHTGSLCSEMLTRGWEVMLLGSPGQLEFRDNQKLPPLMHNLVQAGLTFRQSAAIVASSDVFIGPDSALLHIAGALDMPAVGLYGPFPWQLRTAHSPSILALSGSGACAPCFHHAGATLRNHFPANCPTAAKGYCGVLADIDHRRVAAKAEQIARELPDTGIRLVNGSA